MKSDATEKIKRYSLFIVGVSAHLAVVFALFASALGFDPGKLFFS
jgi:hypothetical protein